MKGKALRKWKEIPIHGEVIQDLFFPFKTPYDNTNILEEEQFTALQFLHLIELKELKVGLVVDLTRTDRYYDKTVLEKKGIEHFKLSCRGFDEPPTEDETQQFVSKCKTFVKQNPDKLIGVHCTHGCNRTGFLICAYLADICKMDILEAIAKFNSARPPGIHKIFDMEELVSRYGNGIEVKLQDFLDLETDRLKGLSLGQ